MSEPPTTIRAAIARMISRLDGDDLLLLFLVLAMCGAAVCAPIAAIIWGAK